MISYFFHLYRQAALRKQTTLTLGTLFENQAVKLKNHTFCLFEGEAISYEKMNERANRRAHMLKAQGFQAGEILALMMENRPEFLESLIAVSKLGGTVAAINFNLAGKSLAHTINMAQSKRIIVGAECLENFKDAQKELNTLLPGEIYTDTRWETDRQPLPGAHPLEDMIKGLSTANPPPINRTFTEHLAFINTSGTTGLPKAAHISELRFLNGGLAYGRHILGLSSKETLYCCLPLYHSMAFTVGLSGVVLNGATLALSRKFSVRSFWKEMTETGATKMIYIGELWRYLANAPVDPYEKKHKVTHIAGVGLRAEVWDAVMNRFGIRHVREFYSATESNVRLVNMKNRIGSVGKPLEIFNSNAHMVRFDVEKDMHMRDENGFMIPCKAGEPGELLGKITDSTPFPGYTSDKETEKKVLHDVFEKGDSYFRTGDLLRKDEQGFYYFLDRIGDTFRWKGENVSTEEVDATVGVFPGAEVVNTYGVQIPQTDGRAGMVSLQMEKETSFDPKAFHKFISENLPVYARPGFMRLVGEMDLTVTLKLRKTDLQKEGFDPSVIKEPLFFRDDKAGTYMPLTREVFEKINTGKIQL